MTTEIRKIHEDIELLKEGLLEKKPERFSAKDVVRSFVGALFIGVTFIFSGMLLNVVKQISDFNLILIIASTIVILIAEIYFVGWSRVKKEKGRNVFEFTLKRLIVFYAVAIAVAAFYSFILGYNKTLSGKEITELIFLVALPCSIGAAIGDLLKKY